MREGIMKQMNKKRIVALLVALGIYTLPNAIGFVNHAQIEVLQKIYNVLTGQSFIKTKRILLATLEQNFHKQDDKNGAEETRNA